MQIVWYRPPGGYPQCTGLHRFDYNQLVFLILSFLNGTHGYQNVSRVNVIFNAYRPPVGRNPVEEDVKHKSCLVQFFKKKNKQKQPYICCALSQNYLFFVHVFIPWSAISYHSFGSECLVNKTLACMLYQ